MIFNWLARVSFELTTTSRTKTKRASRSRHRRNSLLAETLELRQMLSPVIANVETAAGTFRASGTAVAVTSALTVSDSTSTTLSGATLTLGSTFRAGEDQLLFTNTAKITSSYNAASGTLTLTGTDTLANYQAALRSVTYRDTAANPTPNIRLVTISVTDGTSTSAAAYRYINLASLISNVETTTATYAGGSPATPVTNTLTLAATATGKVTGATVQIDANYVNGQDKLSFTNTANIIGSFNTSTGLLTLTGTDTVANYQAALRSVTYVDTSNSPTTGIRRFAFTVDGATNSSFVVDRYFTVNSSLIISNVETTSASFQADGLPVVVTSTLTVTDPGSTTLTGATMSLGSTYRPTEDFLIFTNTGTITGSFNAATGVLTLTGRDTLANYQTALRSVTYRDTAINPTPNVRRVDITVTDGTSTSLSIDRYINIVSLISNVETSTYSYVSGSAATPVTNTLTLGTTPSGQIAGATVQIDANYVNGQDVLAFTNFGNITGSFNTSTGTLTLSGADSIANYQTALRSVTYVDTNAEATLGIRRFAITVNNSTNSSYVVDRYFSVTTSLIISNVETTPVVFMADGVPVPITSTLTLSDPNSTTISSATVSLGSTYRQGEDFLNFTNHGIISGTFEPTTGVLLLEANATLAQYEAAFQSITYQDTSVNPTPNIRRLTFTVTDGTNTSLSVDRYVNIIPLIANVETSTYSYAPGSGHVAISNALTLGATASGVITGATVQIDANYVNGQDVLSFTNTANITGSFNAATGLLTLTGTDNIADYMAALRSVTYINTSAHPTTGIRRFAFTVDGATNPSYVVDRYFNIT